MCIVKNISKKVCQFLNLNCRPLMSEVTELHFLSVCFYSMGPLLNRRSRLLRICKNFFANKPLFIFSTRVAKWTNNELFYAIVAKWEWFLLILGQWPGLATCLWTPSHLEWTFFGTLFLYHLATMWPFRGILLPVFLIQFLFKFGYFNSCCEAQTFRRKKEARQDIF